MALSIYPSIGQPNSNTGTLISHLFFKPDDKVRDPKKREISRNKNIKDQPSGRWMQVCWLSLRKKPSRQWHS